MPVNASGREAWGSFLEPCLKLARGFVDKNKRRSDTDYSINHDCNQASLSAGDRSSGSLASERHDLQGLTMLFLPRRRPMQRAAQAVTDHTEGKMLDQPIFCQRHRRLHYAEGDSLCGHARVGRSIIAPSDTQTGSKTAIVAAWRNPKSRRVA